MASVIVKKSLYYVKISVWGFKMVLGKMRLSEIIFDFEPFDHRIWFSIKSIIEQIQFRISLAIFMHHHYFNNIEDKNRLKDREPNNLNQL